MGDKEKSVIDKSIDRGIDLGEEYPNRACENQKEENADINPIRRPGDSMQDSKMAPVYAGPVLNNTQMPNPNPILTHKLTPEMMMMVYAGPEAMNGYNSNTLRESKNDNNKINSEVQDPANAKLCKKCGAQNQINAKFCDNCGWILDDLSGDIE